MSTKQGVQVMDKLLRRTAMTLYCVKCRKRQDCKAEETNMKNGKPAWKGLCPVCKTGMFKIGTVDGERLVKGILLPTGNTI